MRNLRPLTSRESRKIMDLINEQYDCSQSLDFYFILHERDNTIFIVTRDVTQIDLEAIRVNSLGQYFCELNEEWTLARLSVEGSQLIGPVAKKNVLTLDDETFKLWAKGSALPVTPELAIQLQNTTGYVIIKNKAGDFMAVARQKNNELLNFLPKNRRIAQDA